MTVLIAIFCGVLGTTAGVLHKRPERRSQPVIVTLALVVVLIVFGAVASAQLAALLVAGVAAVVGYLLVSTLLHKRAPSPS
jgi:hypothetical protein